MWEWGQCINKTRSFGHFQKLKCFSVFLTLSNWLTHGQIVHVVKLEKRCFNRFFSYQGSFEPSLFIFVFKKLTFFPNGVLGNLATMEWRAATNELKSNIFSSTTSNSRFKSKFSCLDISNCTFDNCFNLTSFIASPRSEFVQHKTVESLLEKCSSKQHWNVYEKIRWYVAVYFF